MASSSSSPSSYLLPGPTLSSLASMGSKSTLMKPNLPPPVQLSTPFHSIHHMSHPPLAQPFFRSSMPVNSHPNMTRSTPVGDSSHLLTVATANPSSTAMLSTHSSDENNGNGACGGSSGSGGHSLSQSMESINNIGLTDDEVGTNKCSFRTDRYLWLSYTKTTIATWHRSIPNRSILFVDLLVR